MKVKKGFEEKIAVKTEKMKKKGGQAIVARSADKDERLLPNRVAHDSRRR